MNYFVIILPTILCCISNTQSFEMPNDWIDPHDMLKTESSKPKSLKEDKVYVQSPASDNYLEVIDEISLDKRDSLQLAACTCDQPTGKQDDNTDNVIKEDFVFLKRYVAVLLRILSDVDEQSDETMYDIRLQVDTNFRSQLKLFVETNNIASRDVLATLEQSIKFATAAQPEKSYPWEGKFEKLFGLSFTDVVKIGVVILMFIAALTLECLSSITWSYQLRRFVVVVFLISFPMTYLHEYQLAVAEHQSTSSKIPEHCKKTNMHHSAIEGFYIFVRDMFSTTKDPCLQYHETFLIDPILKVPPTKVLAVTFSRFFLEPLSHFGTAFSETFRNMFSKLPIQLWIPAFIFLIIVMIVALMLVSVCFGYTWNVHLPFWSGIEIGPRQHQLANHNVEQLLASSREQLQILQTALDQQSQPTRKPLEPPPSVLTRAIEYLDFSKIAQNTHDKPNSSTCDHSTMQRKVPQEIKSNDPPSATSQQSGYEVGGDTGLRRRVPYPHSQNERHYYPETTIQQTISQKTCYPNEKGDSTSNSLPYPTESIQNLPYPPNFSELQQNVQPVGANVSTNEQVASISGDCLKDISNIKMPVELGFERIESQCPAGIDNSLSISKKTEQKKKSGNKGREALNKSDDSEIETLPYQP